MASTDLNALTMSLWRADTRYLSLVDSCSSAQHKVTQLKEQLEMARSNAFAIQAALCHLDVDSPGSPQNEAVFDHVPVPKLPQLRPLLDRPAGCRTSRSTSPRTSTAAGSPARTAEEYNETDTDARVFAYQLRQMEQTLVSIEEDYDERLRQEHLRNEQSALAGNARLKELEELERNHTDESVKAKAKCSQMAEMLRMSETLCAQQQERVAVLTTQVSDLQTAISAADESTMTLEAEAFKELITAQQDLTATPQELAVAQQELAGELRNGTELHGAQNSPNSSSTETERQLEALELSESNRVALEIRMEDLEREHKGLTSEAEQMTRHLAAQRRRNSELAEWLEEAERCCQHGPSCHLQPIGGSLDELAASQVEVKPAMDRGMETVEAGKELAPAGSSDAIARRAKWFTDGLQGEFAQEQVVSLKADTASQASGDAKEAVRLHGENGAPRNNKLKAVAQTDFLLLERVQPKSKFTASYQIGDCEEVEHESCLGMFWRILDITGDIIAVISLILLLAVCGAWFSLKFGQNMGDVCAEWDVAHLPEISNQIVSW